MLDRHPAPHYGESDERVKPNPRTVPKTKACPTNKARQKSETPVVRADDNVVDQANKNDGRSIKDHELLNKSRVASTNIVSQPNNEEEEILNVQSRNSADLTKSRSQSVNRVTTDAKRRRHRQKRESIINGGRQERDLADSTCVPKMKRVSGDVLNNDLQRSHRSEAEYQTTENIIMAEYSKAETVENSRGDQIHHSSSMKSKKSVGRSVSITSQKSTTESNILENSMTSIDVNRMSIPILGDKFDDETVDTPRSTGCMTPRSDTETYNSLPRVIKVKKSKSMEQMKRNLRRSIKRSRHKIEGVPGMCTSWC